MKLPSPSSSWWWSVPVSNITFSHCFLIVTVIIMHVEGTIRIARANYTRVPRTLLPKVCFHCLIALERTFFLIRFGIHRGFIPDVDNSQDGNRNQLRYQLEKADAQKV